MSAVMASDGGGVVQISVEGKAIAAALGAVKLDTHTLGASRLGRQTIWRDARDEAPIVPDLASTVGLLCSDVLDCVFVGVGVKPLRLVKLPGTVQTINAVVL